METTKRQSKWINEGGIFYPVGDAQLHQSPGKGVFELYQSPSIQDRRIGLRYVKEKFEYPYKLYDLGYNDIIEHVKTTWESEYFEERNLNLGCFFYGRPGTSKSVSSTLLANEIGLPVIMINNVIEGMAEFIESLEFEAVVIIEEVEKLFKSNDDDNVLLRLTEGRLNKARKLYILVANKPDINTNMFGRPSRLRYIKQFGNLPEKAIEEYLEDNLIDKTKKDEILKVIDLLEFSTIDILKSLVDEVNIFGEINENSYLNVPKSKYVFDILWFSDLTEEDMIEVKNFIKTCGNENFSKWLKEKTKATDSTEDNQTNEDYIYDKWSGYTSKLTTQYNYLFRGAETNYGEVVEEMDSEGFLMTKTRDNIYLIRIIGKRSNPSLYRGGLDF